MLATKAHIPHNSAKLRQLLSQKKQRHRMRIGEFQYWCKAGLHGSAPCYILSIHVVKKYGAAHHWWEKCSRGHFCKCLVKYPILCLLLTNLTFN